MGGSSPHPERPRFAIHLTPVLALLLACARTPPSNSPTGAELAVVESLYADLRDLRDRIEVTTASARAGIADPFPVAGLILRHNLRRKEVVSRLAAVDSGGLAARDARALGIMRRTLQRDIDSLRAPAPQSGVSASPPDCSYDARSVLRTPWGLDSLRKRIYDCYGWAQSHVVVDRDTLDRLTILGTLGRTSDTARRRQLFLALGPVWGSINGDNGPASPYRQLIAREVKGRETRATPTVEQARLSGVPPDSLEHWLLEMLAAWRDGNPDTAIEPWDWYYVAGRASRALSPRISLPRLAQLNSEVYRSLGADVEALGVHYDLVPREGKTPVAYTTFGARPRFMNDSWRVGEPWVFATYRTGGLDNLNELLHETGHAVHIAAIRTRPGFADWPDSDPFTEALADFIALEVYEPVWQQHWLGDSVSLADGLRGRYSGIVMDVAWALFEMRMQRNPKADPNRLWTALTHDYLRIRPHPELSWWGMRGQLVDAPGYMMNYAAGSILIAAIRARTTALHGPLTTGDTGWYRWIAPRLFQFGLEKPSREVIEDFLGRPVSPAALLADLRRMNGVGAETSR